MNSRIRITNRFNTLCLIGFLMISGQTIFAGTDYDLSDSGTTNFTLVNEIQVLEYESLVNKNIHPYTKTVVIEKQFILEQISTEKQEEFSFKKDKLVYTNNGEQFTFKIGKEERFLNKNKNCPTHSLISVPIRAAKGTKYEDIRTLDVHLDANQHINMIEFNGQEYYLLRP